MKKACLFAAFTLLISVALRAQWAEVTPRVFWKFQHISVVAADTAFVVAKDNSSKPVLCKTYDGGKHWKMTPIAAIDDYLIGSIDGVVFTDTSHGFLLCSYAITTPYLGRTTLLLRTADGGDNWTEVPLPDSLTKGRILTNLAFSDSKHGVLLSEPTNFMTFVYTTDDGGLTWNVAQFLPGQSYVLKMYAGGTGVIHRDGGLYDVWETQDYGRNWTFIPPTGVEINRLRYRQGFWERNEFYISDAAKYRKATEFIGSTFIFHDIIEYSEDDGQNWQTPPKHVYNSILKQTVRKGNSCWFLYENQLYRHTLSGPYDMDKGERGVLELTPNPVPGGEMVRLQEPRKSTGEAEICVLELATGRELYREIVFAGEGRVVFQTPRAVPGFYLVQFYFGGDLRAAGKLVIR
ncbi:MAG: hypothetical protein IT259_01975 [Saprospiraceae bacterium]|nr:hypothetical protein [Saprospiraceae bacterium]